MEEEQKYIEEKLQPIIMGQLMDFRIDDSARRTNADRSALAFVPTVLNKLVSNRLIEVQNHLRRQIHLNKQLSGEDEEMQRIIEETGRNYDGQFLKTLDVFLRAHAENIELAGNAYERAQQALKEKEKKDLEDQEKAKIESNRK